MINPKLYISQVQAEFVQWSFRVHLHCPLALLALPTSCEIDGSDLQVPAALCVLQKAPQRRGLLMMWLTSLAETILQLRDQWKLIEQHRLPPALMV